MRTPRSVSCPTGDEASASAVAPGGLPEAAPKGPRRDLESGAVVVYDAVVDDERRSNAFGLLMLIETPGGFRRCRYLIPTPVRTAAAGWRGCLGPQVPDPSAACGDPRDVISTHPDGWVKLTFNTEPVGGVEPAPAHGAVGLAPNDHGSAS